MTRATATEVGNTVARLLAAVVGSGIMAAQLSPGDIGLQLLENSIATMLALAVLILALGPASGAHFNPVVTAVDWWLHRGRGLTLGGAGAYVAAQVTGAVAGSIQANTMFALTPVAWSTTSRSAPHLWVGEVVATLHAFRALPARGRRRCHRGGPPDHRGEASLMTAIKPSVLFVCVHNAGRSQMAAGFLRHLAGEAVEVRSAGSQPADQVNPVAVEAMKETGIDITGQTPKILTPADSEASSVVITMGCGDVCPYFTGQRHEDWELDDPAGAGIEAVRAIRDDIRGRVERLIASLIDA